MQGLLREQMKGGKLVGSGAERKRILGKLANLLTASNKFLGTHGLPLQLELSTGGKEKKVELLGFLASMLTSATLKGQHRDNVRAIALSPNGAMLYSGSWDNTIKVWRVDGSGGGSCVGTLEGHTDVVHALALSTDGAMLYSGSSGSLDLWDNTIKLWRMDGLGGGSCVGTLKGHTYTVSALTLSPDGAMLYSGARGPTIKAWRVLEMS